MAQKMVCEALASAVTAYHNCEQAGNTEWSWNWRQYIKDIMRTAPHGSGLDGDSILDQDKSTEDKLIIDTGYHHMNDGGCYDGWTEHRLTIRPSFLGHVSIAISGRNRNDIKDYIAELFTEWLTSPAPARI